MILLTILLVLNMVMFFSRGVWCAYDGRVYGVAFWAMMTGLAGYGMAWLWLGA